MKSTEPEFTSDLTDLRTLFSLANWNPRMGEYNNLLQTNASVSVEGVFEDFIYNLGIPTTPGEDLVSDKDYEELEYNLRKHLREVTKTQGQHEFPYKMPQERSNLVHDAATYCFSGDRCYARGKRIGQLQIPVLFDIMLNCDLFVRWHDTIIRITRAYLEISFEDSMADKLNKLPDIFHVNHQLECVDEIPGNDDSVTDQSGSRSHDTMVDIQADLKKPDCVNWLMGSLILKYLCAPTRVYELCVFEKFKSGLYNSGEHFNDGENVKRISNKVQMKCNKWVYPKCLSHCNECETLFNEIIAHHQKKDQSIGFRNCKTNAVAGAWGIAKLFMSKLHWAKMGPEDSDIQALFETILNCDLFEKCDYAVVDTIISIRNKMMLSPNLTMTDVNLTVLYDSALDFLKNVQEHEKQVVVSAAMGKIEQIKIFNAMSDSDSKQDSEMETDYLLDETNTATASIREDLQKPDYINWVKGTLTLKSVSKGVRHFILMIFTKCLMPTLDAGHFADGTKIQAMCKKVSWHSKGWTHKISCPKCKSLFVEVKNRHCTFGRKTVGFNNCKDTPVGGAFGIAKLFMPNYYKNVTTSEDLDTQALFHLMLNCRMFYKCSVAYMEKIIEIRNKLMHSPILAMTDQDLNELYSNELAFIEEAIEHYCNDDDKAQRHLVSAMKNIEEIRASKMTVTTLVTQTKEAIQYESENLGKHTDQENDESKQSKLKKIELLQNKTECYDVENILSKHKKPKRTISRNIDELWKKLKEEGLTIKYLTEQTEENSLQAFDTNLDPVELTKANTWLNSVLAARKQAVSDVKALQEEKSKLEAEVLKLNQTKMQFKTRVNNETE